MHPCTAWDKVRLYAINAGAIPIYSALPLPTRLDLAQVNPTVIQELMGHANIQASAR